MVSHDPTSRPCHHVASDRMNVYDRGSWRSAQVGCRDWIIDAIINWMSIHTR